MAVKKGGSKSAASGMGKGEGTGLGKGDGGKRAPEPEEHEEGSEAGETGARKGAKKGAKAAVKAPAGAAKSRTAGKAKAAKGATKAKAGGKGKKSKRPVVHYQYYGGAKKRAKRAREGGEGEGRGGQKKEPRKKPGQVALREIRHYQKTTEILLRRLPFQRLVRDVSGHIDDNRWTNGRWKAEALHALQEAAEAYIVSLLEDTHLIALHTRRVTVFPRDLALVRRIRQLTFSAAKKDAAYA